MTAWRRYEFLLPRHFNDGRPVPDGLFLLTIGELRSRFPAESWETQVIEGEWMHGGTSYHDALFRVFLDVPDTPENRDFFIRFKQVLATRFEQLDIWMTAHAVEVI